MHRYCTHLNLILVVCDVPTLLYFCIFNKNEGFDNNVLLTNFFTFFRELSFFFPEFVAPTVPGTGPPPKIQKTLALIRPDALKEHKGNTMFFSVDNIEFCINLPTECTLVTIGFCLKTWLIIHLFQIMICHRLCNVIISISVF